MALRSQRISLRAAADKCVGDDNRPAWIDAVGGLHFPAQQDSKLVYELVGKYGLLGIDEVAFTRRCVYSGFRQSDSTDPLVLLTGVLVREPQSEGIRIAEEMSDHAGGHDVAERSRDVLSDGTVWTDSVDDCLQILLIAVDRQKESSLGTPENRSGEDALVDATLLRRANQGEYVPSVKPRVSESKIESAVELWLSRFGSDFVTPSARWKDLGGVGVVVDFYFLMADADTPILLA